MSLRAYGDDKAEMGGTAGGALALRCVPRLVPGIGAYEAWCPAMENALLQAGAATRDYREDSEEPTDKKDKAAVNSGRQAGRSGGTTTVHALTSDDEDEDSSVEDCSATRD
jgi:hypothetical protein